MKVEGADNVPRQGGFILASNHASYLDPVILGISCPRSLDYMARDTLFRNKAFAWILKQVHVFPIKRSAAYLGAIKEALRRVKNGGGLVLFPEGTRSTDGSLGQGLEGVGFLARKSGAPVIPVYVEGTLNAMPKGANSIKFTRLSVMFGCPIVFSNNDGLTDIDRTRKIMQEIALLKEKHLSPTIY
jgi:1-acyl-sn-glycerol-3-phosphate acyltransferase